MAQTALELLAEPRAIAPEPDLLAACRQTLAHPLTAATLNLNATLRVLDAPVADLEEARRLVRLALEQTRRASQLLDLGTSL